jgi:hypothetical protein
VQQQGLRIGDPGVVEQDVQPAQNLTVRVTIAWTWASAVTSQPIAIPCRPRFPTAAAGPGDQRYFAVQAEDVHRITHRSLAASRPHLPSCLLAAAQPRKRQFPALAATTTTVIYRTARTTSQPARA